jgi:hypothetical protein
LALDAFGIVVPITIATYRLGTFIDDWLFDPLFEPKTDSVLRWLGSRMREARESNLLHRNRKERLKS